MEGRFFIKFLTQRRRGAECAERFWEVGERRGRF